MKGIEIVAQEPDVNPDMCINIAEEANNILTTLTNTLSTILQIKTSNLLNYASNYVVIIIGMVTIFVAVYSIVLDIEILLASGWVLITAIVIASAFLVIYFYANTKFRRILNKLLEGAEPLVKVLKRIECGDMEMFKHYQRLSFSCYQKLCKDNNIDDLKISILCPKLYRLQKIDSNELSSLLLCS